MINRDKDIAINIYLIQEMRKSEWWVKFVSNHSYLDKRLSYQLVKKYMEDVSYAQTLLSSDWKLLRIFEATRRGNRFINKIECLIVAQLHSPFKFFILNFPSLTIARATTIYF